METLAIILTIIGVLASLITVALNLYKATANETRTAMENVSASIASILGQAPTLPTLLGFVALSKEVLATQLANPSLLGSLFDATLIGLGLWVISGHSIGGVVVNKVWGYLFIAAGLFLLTSQKTSKRAAHAVVTKVARTKT